MAETSDVLRAHIDMIVLARLEKEDCYGYRINRDIQSKTPPQYELKEATLYSAFRRLEKEGLIRSYWGDEEAGARRRYYSITDAGKEALAEARTSWQDVKKVVDALVRPAPAAKAKPATVKAKPKAATKPKAAPAKNTSKTRRTGNDG